MNLTLKTLSLACLISVTALASAQSVADLEQVALTTHPKISMAQAALEAAYSSQQVRLAPYRPMLSVNGYAASGNGTPIFPSMTPPVNYAQLGPDTVGMLNVMLMWSIWSGGRDRTSFALGLAEVKTAEAEMEAVRQAVVRDVRLAAADVVYRAEMVAAREADREAAQETEKNAKLREEAGSAPHAFVLRASSQARKAERDLALAQAALRKAVAALDQAVGQETSAIDAEAWAAELTAPSTLDEAVQLGLTHRPELRSLEAVKESFELEAQMVRQSGRPDLTFMAMGNVMDGSSMGFDQKVKYGLVLSIPILDGDSRRNKADEQEAMAEMIEARIASTQLSITEDIEAAWSDWSAASEVLEAARAELTAADESYRTELLRFNSGKSILAELLDAQEMLLTARAAVADAHRYRREAWTRLMWGIGEPPNDMIEA